MTKQDITYQQKLNELRLDVAHPNSRGFVFVFVEGESDIRLFRKFFDLNKCKVECVPGGNRNVERCVAEILKIYSSTIGIRDADFIQLDTTPYTTINMFLTDYHDIEMTIISEDEVFSAVVHEYLGEKKENHATIKDNIIKTIEQLSYLKWLNDIEKLEFSFEAGFQDLISFAELKIEFSEYFKRVVTGDVCKIAGEVAKKHNAFDIVLNKIDTLKVLNPHPLHLCNGHDFMKCFSKYINDSSNKRGLNDDTILSIFRALYRNELFVKTNLYKSIKQWADDNNLSIYL